ncbi:vWA domain-containing protein [Lewinella cohaerens]|uniref:vWA domain-containing protein n=1 Tax=Lewinella cohaerens TaxID=70995 RepID=UPI00035CF8CD|nr:vWA domain-containing protein [Lewinella cohaerens]
MVNWLNKWIRGRSEKSIRNGVILTLLAILITRGVYEDVRVYIDVVTIVLFSVLLTAILRPDIKELITQIKGVGFPGLQIPISEYLSEVERVEEKYSQTITEYAKEEDVAIIDSFTNKIIIDNKIEAELGNIARFYKEISRTQEQIPIGGKKLIDYLLRVDVIGKDIYQLSLYYLNIQEKEISENKHSILRIGIRIWRMLVAIFRKFKDLRILSSAANSEFKGDIKRMQLGGMNFGKIDKKAVSLFSTINIVDDFDNGYPIVQLDKDNFEIIEYQGDELVKAELLEVIPVDSNVKMRIVLALDSSLSMNENNKIALAKDASKALVYSLLSLNLMIDVEFAIYPFNSVNRDGFIDFGEQRIWSSAIEEINEAIDSITPGGDTPLLDALKLSLDVIENFEGYKQIICLSDGIDNNSEIGYDEIYTRAERSNTPIYSVGYGQDEYLEFLVSISKITKAGGENTGSFMRISPENLRNVFSYLSGSINHAYHLRWKPTKYKKGDLRYFDINVNYETQSSGIVYLTFSKLSYTMI